MTYQLPLVGHDMPYVDPHAGRVKARVFKDRGIWTYEHNCPYLTGLPFPEQPGAFQAAWRHMSRCPR